MRKAGFWQHFAWRLEAFAYDLFVALVRALPVDVASDTGAAIVKAIGPITGLQKVVLKNLDFAFPEKDDAWKAKIAHIQWENVGRVFTEFLIMDRITIANGRVVVENMERLKEIAASGTPVVFISGHFSNWEVMPSAILEAGVDCVMTYRAANNPYVDERIREGRARYGVKLFAPKGGIGDLKEMLAKMHEGKSVALMNDQKFNQGILTPFFSRPVHTAPGPTRLAMRYGTVLQPMTVERLHKARFKVIVHDPIHVDSTGNRSADIESTVCKVSKFIEDVVRVRPEEWFWVHKRWAKEAYKE